MERRIRLTRQSLALAYVVLAIAGIAIAFIVLKLKQS